MIINIINIINILVINKAEINDNHTKNNRNQQNEPLIDNSFPLYKVPKDNTKEPIADYSKIHAAGY